MKEISLYEKRQVKLEKVPLMPGMAGSYPPAAIALELVNDLSCALFVRPMVYREPGSLCVNALYPCSSFGCDDFLDEYREILAALSESWDVAVYGSIPERETGELKAWRQDNSVICEKSCVSGQDFEVLYDIALKIQTGSPEEGEMLAEVLGRVSYQNSCVAIPRRYAGYFRGGMPCHCQDGAHFCYLSLIGKTNSSDYLRCLSLEQKAELWREFLEDGLPALEFEWLWVAYQKNGAGLLEWELTLEATVAALDIKVVNENRQFQVVDAEGRPMRFDYTQGRAAEKIFLKILFPIALEKY